MNNPQSAILTESDFRAAISKQCGFPKQIQDRDCDDACQHPPPGEYYDRVMSSDRSDNGTLDYLSEEQEAE